MGARAELTIARRARGLSLTLGLLVCVLIALWPSSAAAWWNDQWTLRKQITIDTGPAAGGITEPIGEATPILVRLHVGNFRFGSAKEDGSDLRFVAGDDKTPLKHHVERYDSLLGEALVWVNVPGMRPGAKNEIWLYYNNQKAPTAVDAKNTYDGDTLVVYHFADRGTPAFDSSPWANVAQNVVPAADGAIIGQGARFDGQAALELPASPSLATTEGGNFTWSVWAKMGAVQPRSVLYSRRDAGNALVIGLSNGVPFVEVTNAGVTQRTGEGAALTAGVWRHIAVTAGGGQIKLYVDGNLFAEVAAAIPALNTPAQVGREGAAAPAGAAPAAGGDTTQPAGGAPLPAGDAPTPAAPAGDPAAAPAAGATPAAGAALAPGAFVGDLDELQISKVVRPPGFIKLAAIGQGPEHAKLITFSVDEEASSWFSGHFAIILQSVTLDGWVVIVLLAIMAVISWVVMVEKVSYLNRVTKANRIFLRHFRESAGDLEGILQLDSEEADLSMGGQVKAKDHKIIHASPLFQIFHLGAQQIRRRFSNGGERTLTPQAIESIQAVLDSGFIAETQRLNKKIVMLTIAISGGPFLGLLGTVVGVMITFAAIAATGDVNVNAIAPGIAAALVATVAGLAVAIPALFGYNYLVTRIKDTTNEMQVFIHEFITRTAESYHTHPNGPMKMAAE